VWPKKVLNAKSTDVVDFEVVGHAREKGHHLRLM
jgi:hypothetical protein